MKKTEIHQHLSTLAENIDHENFIYDFLLSFGISKTTITRLKKGDYNLSKEEGEVLYKGKIFFRPEFENELLSVIDTLAKDPKVQRAKPRFIFVTDFKTVVAIDTRLHTNKEFPIEELADQVDFFLPLSGAEIYRVTRDNKIDRDAAYKMGELYDMLVAENPEWLAKGSHQLNVFLARLLFCFFAEDTGIFEIKSVFTETLANNTQPDGSDVAEFLSLLFQKLNTKQGEESFPHYLEDFPYVNGGLFKEEIECPAFSRKTRQILIDSGDLDWSEINPDIFGSMIQAVADPSERNNLGMHYTSVENILKLIKPLFLDELEEEFEKNKNNRKALRRLLLRMGKIKFFDPACGSGNFLIITYKELRNLEIKIIKRIIDLSTDQSTIFFTEISLHQFYGIEIKDFAHEMAILSLWLAEHQMNQVFESELIGLGQSKPLLPLREAGNITHGNAARLDWEKVCPTTNSDTEPAEVYIIGNPPYLGSRNQDAEQKADMQFVFSKDYKSLDYVSIWFYKGAKYMEGKNAQLALVSTNSICQGLLVALTWKRILNENIEIGFAHQSFKWTNNAKGNAGVTVIIVGLRNKSNKPKWLFTESVAKEVKNINAYLISGNNIYIHPANTSLAKFPVMNFGNMPADGGNLLFNEKEKNDFVEKEPKAKKWIKQLISAHEFLNGKKRYCLWLESISDKELNDMPLVKERVRNVYKLRLKSSRPQLAEIPHLFAQITQPANKDFILIPRHSSEERDYIPLGFFDKSLKSSDSALIVATEQPWLFGVLHSKMHMVWVDAVGGKLKTDYRYSAKLCYNTFPFPEINDRQKHLLREYVFSILDARAKYPEKTMAWMYNPETMPSDLKKAHEELDAAVERIYRLTPFKSDEERLEYLFKLYEEMIKKETLFAKEKKVKGKKK